MRFAAVAVAVLALAACNQNTTQSASTSAATTASGPSGGGLFPDLFGAAYRSDVTMTMGSHVVQAVITRDGHKMRMEMDSPQGHQIIIVNPDTHDYIGIMTAGGRQMALRMDPAAIPDTSASWHDLAAASHRTGDCTVAGEHGSVWEHQDEGGANQRSVCVTNDGILLRATNNGETTWEATSVQRGPQSADQFRAPAGVRVMQMPTGAAAAIAKMREGNSGQ